MVTITRETRTVHGVNVVRHSRSYDGSSWSVQYLITRPINAARHWLRDLLESTNMIYPIGSGVAGEFFADAPMIKYIGRGKVYIYQRCGYDV